MKNIAQNICLIIPGTAKDGLLSTLVYFALDDAYWAHLVSQLGTIFSTWTGAKSNPRSTPPIRSSWRTPGPSTLPRCWALPPFGIASFLRASNAAATKRVQILPTTLCTSILASSAAEWSKLKSELWSRTSRTHQKIFPSESLIFPTLLQRNEGAVQTVCTNLPPQQVWLYDKRDVQDGSSRIF